MIHYFNYFKCLLANKKGQGMVEYVLLVGLIAIAVIAVLILLGPALSARFQQVIDGLNGTAP